MKDESACDRMTPFDTDSESDYVQSVVRAFNIVEVLGEEEDMTMSELAEKFGMPRSTAHIYLKTLVETGYVVRQDDQYRLGFRFLKHGGYVRHRLQIYQTAKSEVDALARRTGEVVDFGIEENGKRVLVYKSEGPDVLTQKPVTGDYAHMHMTALGKAMLATLDEDHINDIINEHGLPKSTQQTIDTRADLFADLERVRNRGYSVENQERRKGIRAVGVPIDFDEDGPSAISISGPMSKLTDERIEELQAKIDEAINIIQIKIHNY